jgi:hypothetical protein
MVREGLLGPRRRLLKSKQLYADPMPLPTSYLTSVKNVEGILNAIKAGQAPETFSQAHLRNLGFSSSSDRLMIPVLKAIGFLSDDGGPTQRYFDFLDQGQSAKVLAAGIREAYADLFQINRKANDLEHSELVNKLKTLTEGKYKEDVLSKMASTFKRLCELADFSVGPAVPTTPAPSAVEAKSVPAAHAHPPLDPSQRMQLNYTISIQLPVSRDQAVYDAIFRSLRAHLLG